MLNEVEAQAIPEEIFRAYDIRGVVEEGGLSPECVYTIARAIGSAARTQNIQQLFTARDGRLSSPTLYPELLRGLQASGCDVIDLGCVPTPVLYFALQGKSGASGVMLTGSHNPAAYNGLKMVLGGQRLSSAAIRALRQRIIAADFVTGAGRYQAQAILPAYQAAIVARAKLARPLKVVVDCGNGVAGVLALDLFKALGCDVTGLYCEVDGRFPNHHPDPSKPENLTALQAAVLAAKADIGLAFDGDADRLGVVTNTGRIIWPDRQLMLFAEDILQRQPGGAVVFDGKCSAVLAEVIQAAGGVPVRWKTGHSFIQQKMQATQAVLGGEMSGHLFFKESWFGFDDGMYAGARLLSIVARQALTVDALFAKFPERHSTPELTINVSDAEKFKVIERLAACADFPDAALCRLDGIRVTWPFGWCLIRASNTTPCLTLRLEANSAPDLAVLADRLKVWLQQVGLVWDCNSNA